ncbi:hypothetical protein [Chitinophaga filiformis]|uniref:Uncharacterized protein n=1 Tax=Chitinophaga filiformis TaxID=104663 RepID=A0A1G8E900_CHIFI|nr:hypothetical protein [Chitinophaga filiformis]SDH66418.1 hypothetical protein SAMN04488121_11739 [Chitinophaga filiformis]
MTPSQQFSIPPGWVGGFPQSNSHFAYPYPNLSSLPMLDNMDNIDLLERQQSVEWPEFSWETEKGKPDTKRCFVMFSPDISRIGYDDYGRVYSIICPQQGIWIPGIGCLNVEVTVTGQRGWVDEPNREFNLAADMTVEGKIWFSPSAKQNLFVKLLWSLFRKSSLPFPSEKAHAIKVTTHEFQNPAQPIFPVRRGESSLFVSPEFARHPHAWGVGNVEVEIGPIVKTNHEIVDEFNTLVMDLFNLASGNMLQRGNLLSWNVWFTEPCLVNKEEWRTHAERWRHSIDEDHGSPTGPGRAPKFFNGEDFHPIKERIEEKIQEIIDWILHHL